MSEQSRRQRRLGVALEVRLRGKDRLGLPFELTTFSDNISRGGCQLETSREVPAGTELEIEILRRAAGRRLIPFFTTGLVLRATPTGPDQYTIAIQFTGPHFPTFSSEETAPTGF